MKIKTFLGIAITLLVLSVSKIQAQQVVVIEVTERDKIDFTVKTIFPDNSIEITEYNKGKADKIDPALLTKKEIEKWVRQGFSLESISDVYSDINNYRYRTIVLIKKED